MSVHCYTEKLKEDLHVLFISALCESANLAIHLG